MPINRQTNKPNLFLLWLEFIVLTLLFCTCRARDRRLGRPIQSMNDLSNPSTPNVGTLNAVPSGLNYSPADQIAPAPVVSQSAHSGPSSLLPALSIPPQYKAGTFAPIGGSFGQHTFNNATSYSPTSSLSPSRLVSRSQDPNLSSPLYFNSQKPAVSPNIFSKSDSHSTSKLYSGNMFDTEAITSSELEEPLDLSVRTKMNSSLDLAADDSFNSFESEVLNLSQKSSRPIHDIDKLDLKDAVHTNVSLALLQQQHEIDGANLRNVLHNNGKLPDDSLNFNKAYSKPNENEHKISRSRKRTLLADIDSANNSNDSNNNILEGKNKSIRLSSPSKELKCSNNGMISNQNSPEHNQGEGLFTCDQCDKTFSKQSSLARHKYEHSGTTL